ncbi:MAG: glycosyltransferase, partial [Terracidiphilus sp.]
PDVVKTGINGIVLRERSAAQLAEGLLTLLADDALARRMGEQGRRCVESQYSARRMAERYESVYHECITSLARSAIAM